MTRAFPVSASRYNHPMHRLRIAIQRRYLWALNRLERQLRRAYDRLVQLENP